MNELEATRAKRSNGKMNEREKFGAWLDSPAGNTGLCIADIFSAHPSSDAWSAWQACAAEKDKELSEAQARVKELESAIKPAYIFYMIEVDGAGWLKGREYGEPAFTHSVEDAITFFDKQSAEIVLIEYFGSKVSYMHPRTYGRVSVTEHMWCNKPFSFTTPDQALQRALLDARIDEQNSYVFCLSRLAELRAKRAELGE